MLANLKVGTLGSTMAILLAWGFDEWASLGRGGLRTSGSRGLKSAPANCAVGLAGVKVDHCSNKGNGDCCLVELFGSKVPGTLCCDVLGKGCSSGLSSCSGLWGSCIAFSRQFTSCLKVAWSIAQSVGYNSVDSAEDWVCLPYVVFRVRNARR